MSLGLGLWVLHQDFYIVLPKLCVHITDAHLLEHALFMGPIHSVGSVISATADCH
jgi:hypothetical protein